MKRLLFFGLLLIHSAAGGIEKGTSRDAVLAELGEPQGSMQNGGKEILLFKTGTVTLQNGVVIEADLSQDYVRQAEERALKAKEIRAAKQAEQEKQKVLYPEDHVIQIGCAYTKTENWDYLPESIRPKTGEYRYDVYIPPGYHESDRRKPVLFLESPVLWDSVKERIRKEKWMVVILQDASQQQTGQMMNGNFLAAFDDAAERFRISSEYRFIAGRVPAAIFATMRPVAGIILQEPDFRGFEKAGLRPDFIRKNSNLRVYALLGNRDADNVRYQGKFIIERIQKYYLEVYQGETAILPQPLADQAIDWMKKEYGLP
jgi:hypothetical protein